MSFTEKRNRQQHVNFVPIEICVSSNSSQYIMLTTGRHIRKLDCISDVEQVYRN
jgi:hypothetical protein